MKYKIVIDKQSRTNPSSEKKEYEVDIEELRVRRNIYDSIIITREEAYVLRKLKLEDLNVLKILDEPKKEPLKDIKITLFEGDNYIYLVDVYGNKMYAEYLIKNDFNDIYVTKNEMNSAINQTAQSVELSVNQKLTGYSTTEEMNSAINIKSNEITSSVNKKLENYDTSSEVNSKIEQKADSITSSVSKTYSTKQELTTAKSEIKQTTDSITSTVSKKVGNNEVISKINQSAETVTINANKVNLSGYVTVSNLKTAGKTTINGSNITTGTIDASKATITNINASNIKSGTISGRAISGGSITGTTITNGNNFKVDVNGNMSCSNATIKNGKIELQSGTSASPNFKIGKNFYLTENYMQMGTDTPTYTEGVEISGGNGSASIGVTQGDNQTFISPRDITTGYVYANNISSDQRLKENIKESNINAIDILKKINVKSFDWKKTKKHVNAGIIAQEVEKIDDNFVLKKQILNKKKEAIDYQYYINELPILVTAIKAIQEQQKQIEQLKEKDKQKDEIIANLIERIETLEKEVNNGKD